MTSAISIFWIFRFLFYYFSNFPGTFRSFCSFEKFSSNSLCRCDFFGPNFVKIRAILAIFRSFEDFQFSRRALSSICNNYRELWLQQFPGGVQQTCLDIEREETLKDAGRGPLSFPQGHNGYKSCEGPHSFARYLGIMFFEVDFYTILVVWATLTN